MESHCRLQLGELSSSEIYPTELSNDTEIQISLCLLRHADRICCVCLSLAMWRRNGCELIRKEKSEKNTSAHAKLTVDMHTQQTHIFLDFLEI